MNFTENENKISAENLTPSEKDVVKGALAWYGKSSKFERTMLRAVLVLSTILLVYDIGYNVGQFIYNIMH